MYADPIETSIYCMFFPNGKMYFGKTKMTLEERFDLHVKKRKCPAAYDAIKKFGKQNVIMMKVRQCYSNAEANICETRYIESFRTLVEQGHGYNLTKGGDGGTPCEVTRAKMRISQQARDKMSYHHGLLAATAYQIEDAIHWVA
jgi:hypothetical protein